MISVPVKKFRTIMRRKQNFCILQFIKNNDIMSKGTVPFDEHR